MTQCEIIRNDLNKSNWEITKDKCDSTRAHRRHLAANGKHENKRKIYCTNVHLRIIEILFTLMYKLSAVTAAVTASGPRGDAEMTGTSGAQESAGPLPTATTCSVPQEMEPPTEYVPGGHPDTTSRHTSPTSAALDQDRVTMPPPPPGHRSKGARVPSTTRN